MLLWCFSAPQVPNGKVGVICVSGVCAHNFLAPLYLQHVFFPELTLEPKLSFNQNLNIYQYVFMRKRSASVLLKVKRFFV